MAKTTITAALHMFFMLLAIQEITANVTDNPNGPFSGGSTSDVAQSPIEYHFIATVEFYPEAEATGDRVNSVTATLNNRVKRNPVLVGAAAIGAAYGAKCVGGGLAVSVGRWLDGKEFSWERFGDGCASAIGRRKRHICGRKKRMADCRILGQAFALADKDNDNRVEFDDLTFQQGINMTAAKAFFESKDINGDGYLEPEELHPCLNGTRVPSPVKSRAKRCSYGGGYSYYPQQTYEYVSYGGGYYYYPQQSYVIYV